MLGGRAIDKRTALGRALQQWRTDLIADLGGVDVVSTQQQALIDLCVKTKLILDSIDAWILGQPTLIHSRHRALYPVVLQRQTLANALTQYLGQLGLERRRPQPIKLETYLAERAQGKPDSRGDRDAE